ncbi:MAG: putative metal-binding motif-containing protein [Alphaproteobacteria bacterium]|nr:putative metal-binding motif-containing protein [Alphaproteobacteria bacterium]
MRPTPRDLLLALLALSGCSWTAAGKTTPAETASPDDSGLTTDDTADTGAADDTGDTTDPRDVDDDGDGFTENEGDCNDAEAQVYPDAEDVCDGLDNDCDGELDEDATGDDPYEPNDETPYDLGSLEDTPTHQITATLHNDLDEDRFQFYVEDSWLDSFTVDITLANVPQDATYRLTLNRLRSDGDEPTGQVDQAFGGGSVQLVLEDRTGPEDGGDYEIVVEAVGGADCAANYLLTIEMR